MHCHLYMITSPLGKEIFHYVPFLFSALSLIIRIFISPLAAKTITNAVHAIMLISLFTILHSHTQQIQFCRLSFFL